MLARASSFFYFSVMIVHSYGIYKRFDGIKLAYVCYKYAHGSFRLDCAICPDDFASVFDKSKKYHKHKVICIARHWGARGGFHWFDKIRDKRFYLEVYNPETCQFIMPWND